jgi:hypothetical protein
MKVISRQPIEVQSSANGLVNYVATSANQNIGANYNDFSIEEEGDDFLSNFEGEDLGSEFSCAFGDTVVGKTLADRRARKNSKRKAKDEAKVIKANAKLEEQKAKTAMATSAEKGDVALAQALATPAATEGKKPMSKNVKIAIGVGAFLVLAGIGLVVYKMKKGK